MPDSHLGSWGSVKDGSPMYWGKKAGAVWILESLVEPQRLPLMPTWTSGGRKTCKTEHSCVSKPLLSLLSPGVEMNPDTSLDLPAGVGNVAVWS